MWASPTPSEAPSQPCLLFLTGVEAGRVMGLDSDLKIRSIGRADTCEVAVDSPEISRVHAQLSLIKDGRLQITDMGSLNGTFVNGRRVAGETLRRIG